jgi:TRAP-type C4-dicarboxylate transport system permease small subunit
LVGEVTAVPYHTAAAARDGVIRALTRPAGAVYDPRAMPVLRFLGFLPHVIVTLLMLFAMADMLAGVFLRYVMTKISMAFDLPSIRFFWVEEIGELCLAWMTFIGAAIGIRRGVHFSVQIVTDRFAPGARMAVFTVHYLLIAGLGAVIAYYGWHVAEQNSLSFSPALDLNLRWLYLSAVVGGVLIVIYSLASIADGWRGRWPALHTPEAE